MIFEFDLNDREKLINFKDEKVSLNDIFHICHKDISKLFYKFYNLLKQRNFNLPNLNIKFNGFVRRKEANGNEVSLKSISNGSNFIIKRNHVYGITIIINDYYFNFNSTSIMLYTYTGDDINKDFSAFSKAFSGRNIKKSFRYDSEDNMFYINDGSSSEKISAIEPFNRVKDFLNQLIAYTENVEPEIIDDELFNYKYKESSNLNLNLSLTVVDPYNSKTDRLIETKEFYTPSNSLVKTSNLLLIKDNVDEYDLVNLVFLAYPSEGKNCLNVLNENESLNRYEFDVCLKHYERVYVLDSDKIKNVKNNIKKTNKFNLFGDFDDNIVKSSNSKEDVKRIKTNAIYKNLVKLKDYKNDIENPIYIIDRRLLKEEVLKVTKIEGPNYEEI